MRDFYWIDAEMAAEAGRRMGLAAFGCMATICALAYTRNTFLPANDDAAAAGMLNCQVAEWTEIKARLLTAGDLAIVDDLIVPAASWARPEMDG